MILILFNLSFWILPICNLGLISFNIVYIVTRGQKKKEDYYDCIFRVLWIENQLCDLRYNWSFKYCFLPVGFLLLWLILLYCCGKSFILLKLFYLQLTILYLSVKSEFQNIQNPLNYINYFFSLKAILVGTTETNFFFFCTVFWRTNFTRSMQF